MYDLLIKGGRVIDPAQNTDGTISHIVSQFCNYSTRSV